MEPLASVKAHLSALLDEVSRTHEQYTVTRNGHPVAVILAAEDYESLMESGTYSVRDRVEEGSRIVVVLDIAGRGDAYDPTRR